MAASNGKHKQPKKGKKAPPARQEFGVAGELIGLSVIGLGALCLFFAFAGEDSAVAKVLRGLAGHLSYLLPLIFFWVGALILFSGKFKRNPGRIALIAGLFAVVFAGVHLFAADEVTSTLYIHNWLNFAIRSYDMQVGAGMLGALPAYPLYAVLGKWGGLIALVVLGLGDLTLLRAISLRRFGEKAGGYIKGGVEDMRRHRAEVRATRREMAVEEATPAPPSEMYIEQIAPIRHEKREKQTVTPSLPGAYDVPEHMKRGKRKRVLLESGGEAETLRPEHPVEGLDVAPEESISTASIPAEEANIPESLSTGDDIPPFDLEPSRDDKVQDAVDIPSFARPKPSEGAARKSKPTPDPYEMPSAEKSKPSAFEMPATTRSKPLPDVQEAQVRVADVPVSKPSIDKPEFVSPKRAEAEKETDLGMYCYPPLNLLQRAKTAVARDQTQRDREKAKKLEETLLNFNISAELVGIAHGPAVTRFELAPAPGIKLSRITSLADDIALSLAAYSVRIEAPIPGKAAVGIEIPNDEVEVVPLRDVLESDDARRHASRLAVALGKDNSGRYVIADLARMPHLLIAGSTGSGKSACINSIICSILYRATPDEVRLILVDPKMVELSVYNGIPHLLVPVVTEAKKAPSALTWAVVEMSNRYRMFTERGVREIKGYNLSLTPDEKPLPQIVIVIDELSDLMMIAPGEVEDAILRLSQLARAAGIHLVIATQRPSVNVVTGVIKVNIPSRIAFTVTSQVDSRTILDMAGAEKLLGRGDMLYMPQGAGKPHRVQGSWVSDEEVHGIVEFIKRKHGVEYDEDAIEHINNQAEEEQSSEEKQDDACDEYLPQAIEMAVESGQASISMLQRRLRVGYARAGRLIDEMAARGIISQSEGAKPRTVLITREQFNLMFDK